MNQDQISSINAMSRDSLSICKLIKFESSLSNYFGDDADSFLNLSMRSLNEVMQCIAEIKFRAGEMRCVKEQEKRKDCFHNSCCSNEFEKRMDVRRDVTTQQDDDEHNDEVVDHKNGHF